MHPCLRYDTISVYLTCSKKLTGSQLSSPHGTNKKLKCETKNKLMSMIHPVQSHYHEGSPVGKKYKVGRICWLDRFWAWSERVKDDERDGLTSGRGGKLRPCWWGWRNESGTWFQRQGVMYIWTSDLWFSGRWLVVEKGWEEAPLLAGDQQLLIRCFA